MALIDLLKFVTTGSWGTGEGVLSASEVDGNFAAIAEAVDALTDNPPEAVSVSNITKSGTMVTFHMSDGSQYGPFEMPVATPRFRDEWAAYTLYEPYDIVLLTEFGTFMVGVEHTSEATFDPAASNSSGDYYVKIAPPTGAPAEVYMITTDTLTLSNIHAGKYLRFTNGDGCTVTVPGGTFPPNSEIHFRQLGGVISIVPESTGVVINPQGSDQLMSGGAGATFTLKHFMDDEFDIFGKLAPGSA